MVLRVLLLVGGSRTFIRQPARMQRRVSLTDVEIAWRAVEETARNGRGGLERPASAFTVHRSVVMDAIDRVEIALGRAPFFVMKIRRTGALSPAGEVFRCEAPRMIRAWKALAAALDDVGAG